LTVSDAGLAHLAELTNLELLFLEQTAVTDAGLKHLERLTKLKLLALKGTRVTSFGARKLQLRLRYTAIDLQSGFR
jgi:hypothetical protein